MAAPTKKGLDYYPRDVGLLKDRKFIKAKIKYGYLAIVVYDALLEMIYQDKGYYLQYKTDEDKEAVAWDILDSVRGKYPVEADTIYEVIGMLVECRLFSHDYFKQGIITSKRIQQTYYKATVERKNVEVDKEIWLLSTAEMKAISSKSSILSFFINQQINEVNQPINGDNQSNNEQSKVNKSKVNKSKVKESESVCECTPPTLEEIQAYCAENGLKFIDPAKFYYYYNTKNWEGVSDWKSKAQYWNIQDKGTKNSKNVFNNFQQRKYTEEEIKKIIKKKQNEA